MTDESPSLEQELLEDSERVFHADVTRFQVAQWKRMRTIILQADDWIESEIMVGGDRMQLKAKAKIHIVQMRDKVRKEFDSFLIKMEMEKAWRDKAIHDFILHPPHAA